MNKLILTASLCAASILLASGAASAAITGTVYQDDSSSTDASVFPASSLPSANFPTSAIDFNTGDSDTTTTADFLNDPVFTGAANGFDPTATADNIFLAISGRAYLLSGDNSFVVGHDDGVVITFPALNGGAPIVDAPGPTSLDETPFTVTNPGSAGLYTFNLQYAECCGGPANLDFTVNGQPPIGVAPEPSTWVLLIAGLGGVGLMLRRAREKIGRRAFAA